MRGLPKRDTVVGWAFFAAAYFLISDHFQVEAMLHLRTYSLLLFPTHLAAQYFFMGVSLMALLLAAGLLAVTGWGTAHQRTWSRWTGLMPCLYLLAGFPYLTLLGALGLWYLWTQQTVEQRVLTGSEFWNPRRKSGWTLTASALGWFVALLAFDGLRIAAYGADLPLSAPANPGVIAILALMWIHIVFHECGHAVAARLVGFRVKVVAFGPLVVSKESGRRRVRFEWRGLFLLGGYMGAVPGEAKGFRTKQTIVIASGPIASLLTGGVLLAVAFLLPGTGFQNYWPLVAMGAVIGFYIGIVNLVPVGYCDGTMLFHLLLRTRRGAELEDLILRGARLVSSVQVTREYHDDVADRRAALQQLLDSPAADPAELGARYIALGSAQISAGERRDAERNVTQGLALLPEGVDPSSEGTGWECLLGARMDRYDQPGAAEAYGKALHAACLLKSKAQDPEYRLQADLWIASLHCQAHAWAETLQSTATALAVCPDDKRWRMWKGMLLYHQAQGLLQTGCQQAGLDAVRRAAEIFRTQPDGVKGPHFLGLEGMSLCNAGRTEDGLSLVRECIALLEVRGAFRLASSFRLCIAEVLRNAGKVARAACVLPSLKKIGPEQRVEYHSRRGGIRLRGGKLPEAIADLTLAVSLIERDIPVDEIALGVVRTLLADALAEAGAIEAAEQLATQARETLAAAGHPWVGAAYITLAIVGWRKTSSPGSYVEEALRVWDAAPLMLPAQKARSMEEAAESLQSAGLAAEAAECRTAATRHWQTFSPAPEEKALVAGY